MTYNNKKDYSRKTMIPPSFGGDSYITQALFI